MANKKNPDRINKDRLIRVRVTKEEHKRFMEKASENGYRSLLFVEAKKTTPNFENCGESQEKLKKYQDYVYSIRDKFDHSVSTYISMRLGRSDASELSEKMIQEDIKSLRIVLVFVVKNSYPSSLIHYKEKFDSILKPEKSIWKINDVIVISEAMAKKKGLVTE